MNARCQCALLWLEHHSKRPTDEQARTIAEEYIRTMKNGIDPIEVKKAEIAKRAEDERSAVTLQEVLESYVNRPNKLKPSTAAEYRRHVEKVFTAWKDKPITSITRDMVQERHREIVDNGLEGKKAASASANAAFVTLRILFRHAMDEYVRGDGEPLITLNPVNALKNHWAKTGDREERYIGKAKIGEVWNKLQAERGDPRSRDALAGIDLTIMALLTGARRDELAALTWDRVHIDDHNPSECSWHLYSHRWCASRLGGGRGCGRWHMHADGEPAWLLARRSTDVGPSANARLRALKREHSLRA